MAKKDKESSANKWSQNEGFFEDNKNERKSSAFVVLTAFFILVLISAIVLAGTKLSEYLQSKEGGDPVTGAGVSLDIREADYSQSDDGYSAQEICAKIAPSVVTVRIYAADSSLVPRTEQSGVVISDDGYILTNASALNGCLFAEIVTDGGASYLAEIVGRDSVTDAAVLKIKATALKPIVGNSVKVQSGERAIALGTVKSFSNSVSEGLVSGVDRIADFRSGTKTVTGTYIQTDFPQGETENGGFLFNRFGELVGMFLSGSSRPSDRSLAVPIKELGKITGSIIENGYVSGRYRLGVEIDEVSDIAAQQSMLSAGCLRIAYIDPLSNLNDYGILAGDFILSVEGAPCSKLAALLAAIEKKGAGETLAITVYNAEKQKTTELSIALIEDNGM